VPETLSVLAVTGAMAAAYGIGVRRLWARAGAGHVVHRWQVSCFALGTISMLAVLVGPLDAATHDLLWAHMTQHMVLIVISAPLLVLGAPLPAVLWALPPSGRAPLTSLWRRAHRSSAGSAWLVWAASAFTLHALALWVWHLPGPYEAAVHHEALHLLEHASFLVTAVLFWWTVIGARRRSTYGLGVLAVFLMAFQGTALGAWMTIAGAPWYPSYAAGAHGLSALDDQQLAGVIMWCPGGFAYLAAAAAMFYAWVAGEERRHPSAPASVPVG
jgi:putative membrane protein